MDTPTQTRADAPSANDEASRRVPSSSDWFASLREYVDAEELAKTRRIFDGHHVSHDLIVIATALRGLAEACDDAAEFALADERPLKAEEYQQRGAAYRKCYKTLVKVWDGREANK